eukprot:CAMPEP_0201883936 /NCGR_PEP_ID=MMETSP0902-20130614/16315_1 /ASSEMBLY_ACC=CAM_ASM_000551 /TAXON_ID=420261 /ORGANISM="Thalassiosira antarctica, Strain CCMP982" /LENGTH=308 /DNA_ID=CAMNT_0048412805 /DNA_START=60 /DNA_END=986 /DNA_ORIENTATION=+
MVKSLHRSLEAKLASIKDPEFSESDGEEENAGKQSEGISAKREGKGTKRKADSNDDDEAANEPSTVIYLGHLPVGFEEREITVFLNQFGNVKRCRVSRSTKTGRSRGYAFVEFADEEVAGIVAGTMSGYFLLEKRMVCHILPNDKVHELMFAKPKRVSSKSDRQKKARAEVNKRRSADALKGITAKLVQREEMKHKKLAALGIDYGYPGHTASVEPVAETNKSSKKKRKVSDDDEKKDETNNVDEVKTPKSQKKKKKKSKKVSAEETVEEKENEATIEDSKAAATAEPAKKKKRSKSKTPKAKTPKNK